jgi:hypothetical protein
MVKLDKFTESFNIKIPEVTKFNLEKMTPAEIKNMNEEFRLMMARHIHNSAAHFNPSLYLSSENATETE